MPENNLFTPECFSYRRVFSKTVAPVLAGLEVKSNDLIISVFASTFFVALGTAAGNVSHCDSPRLPGDVLDRERGGGREGTLQDSTREWR